MKRLVPVLLILGISFAVLRTAGAQEAPFAGIPFDERLVYKITWLGVPVATGEVWVKEKVALRGREAFHVVGHIETNRILRTIFPMRDEIHSWIDAETLESLQFEKDIHGIRVKAHEKVIFDRAKKKGYFKSFTTGAEKELTVVAPVHDVLSAFYWIRRQQLVPGQPLKAVVAVDQKDWNLTANVLGQETVKVQGEKVDTLSVQPETFVEGKPKLGKMQMNVTLDASRTPVRVTYKAPFGRVVGTLQNQDTR